MNAQKVIALPPPLPPPPRRIIERRKSGDPLLALLFCVFLVAGLCLMCVPPMRWYIRERGTPVRVTIDRQEGWTRSIGGNAYFVIFHYTLNGKRVYDKQRVSSGEYLRDIVGQSGEGRAMRILGFPVCLTDLGDAGAQTRIWIAAAVVANAAVWLWFAYGAIRFRRLRKLAELGTAVTGTIDALRVSLKQGRFGLMTCRFTTAEGENRRAVYPISKIIYESVVIGSPVTVLYDPARRKRSMVYEFCPFVVSG
jgi:hypothetical protein